MINNIIGEMALSAAAGVVKNKKTNVKQLDPATIMIIIKIITTIIQCYLDRKVSAEEAVELSKNPGFFNTFIVNRLIAKELKKHKAELGSNPSEVKKEIKTQVYEIGKKVNTDKVYKAVACLNDTVKFLRENE